MFTIVKLTVSVYRPVFSKNSVTSITLYIIQLDTTLQLHIKKMAKLIFWPNLNFISKSALHSKRYIFYKIIGYVTVNMLQNQNDNCLTQACELHIFIVLRKSMVLVNKSMLLTLHLNKNSELLWHVAQGIDWLVFLI